VVIECFSIAVVARLVSLPVVVGAGIVLLGVGHALLSQVNPHVIPLFHAHVPSVFTTARDNLLPNISVIILFLALVLYRKLDEVGGGGGRGLASRSLGARRRDTGVERVAITATILVLVALPFLLSHITLPYAQIMIADIVVFVSIVGVTGFSGNITLGQAAFAGFGAFTATRVVQSLHWPVVVAMLVGGGFAVVLGILTALPAVKRRGLFLGLT